MIQQPLFTVYIQFKYHLARKNKLEKVTAAEDYHRTTQKQVWQGKSRKASKIKASREFSYHSNSSIEKGLEAHRSYISV
jgi:hypothetical protein